MSTVREKIGQNVSASVAVILFLGTTLFLTLELRKSSQLEEALKTELLAKETLLSEKLAVAKETAIAKSNYKDEREKSHSLEYNIRTLQNKLEVATREMDKLRSRNAAASQLERQSKKLAALNAELNEKQRNYQNSLAELQKLNDELNFTVSFLQDEVDELRASLAASRLTGMNAMLIEPTRRNSKLTVAAKRTKKLKVTLDVPAEASNLNFVIVNPAGKELSGADGTILVNSPTALLQSYDSHKILSPGLEYKRVEMTYAPTKTLTPGIYSIRVLNDAGVIGSLQVKLR